MEYLLIVTFVVAFIMSFLSYRQGLKDGLNINKNEQLKPIIEQKPKPNKEERKVNEQIHQGVLNRLNYMNRRAKN